MVDIKKCLIKGGSCGALLSSIFTFLSILSLLFPEIGSIGIILCPIAFFVLTFRFLSSNNVKNFMLSALFSVIAFCAAEVLLSLSQISGFFYRLQFGPNVRPSAGEGFGIGVMLLHSLFVYLFALFCSFFNSLSND